MGRIFSLFSVFAVIFTVALMVPGASKAGDLEVGGYVSIVAEDGDDSNGGFRHDEGTFAVEEVEINFHKELADGVSVTVDAQFGGAANVTGGHADVALSGPWGMSALDEYDCCAWVPTEGSGPVDVLAFGIEQAFVTIPAGPVALQVGLFNLPIGLEGADKTDITTATHSLIFNYAVPTSGAGVMASFAPEGSPINVDIYGINGWDMAVDNNSAKTLGGRIGLDLGDIASVGLSFITGRENANPVDGSYDSWLAYRYSQAINESTGWNMVSPGDYADSETTVIDIDITVTPIEALTIGLEINEGEKSNVGIATACCLPDGSTLSTDAEWSAWTLSANYKFNETCGITVRLEEMEDTDAVLLGVESKSSYNGGKAGGATWESTTVAVNHHIADGAELVLEWREISADVHKDQGIFNSGGKGTTSTEMVTAEFVYQF